MKRPGKTFCINLRYKNVEREQKRKTWAMHPIFHSDSKTGSEMALDKKGFVCERTYDKVESDCAMFSLILKFILILRQETKILKKNKPYLTINDIYLFSCRLVQFKVSLH